MRIEVVEDCVDGEGCDVCVDGGDGEYEVEVDFDVGSGFVIDVGVGVLGF